MADNFDKFLPDWQIGTLTLTANSTAFTATDALLTFGSIQQGDFIISPDGRMLVIESIADDDNGVLSTPCPPEAAGTFQTRIRYQSDNSRYTGQTAALRRLLSGGNLFALSKLAGDPEMIVRFLANGSFDLVDPATFGLQDPNGSLANLAALTLGKRQILQTDVNGALKVIALAANKLVNTDANGDILLSDITAYARTLLDDADVKASRATIGALRPAFRAFYPSSVGIANGDYYLSIPSTSLNVGNLWSGSQFTCNEAGIYKFDCNFVTAGGASNTGTMVASIDVGTNTVGSTAKTKDNYFDPVYASTVVRLNVGDIVRFKLSLTGLSGSVEMLAARSAATGVLIG